MADRQKVQFYRGLESNLPGQPVEPGKLSAATDTGNVYLDYNLGNASVRRKLTDTSKLSRQGDVLDPDATLKFIDSNDSFIEIGGSSVSSSADTLSAWRTWLDVLTQTSAASLYLTQTAAAGTYLTKVDAANTYLSQLDAAATYLTQAAAAELYVSTATLSNYYTRSEVNSLLSSSLATYITRTEADSLYLTQAAAAGYLTKTEAGLTYLTQASAAQDYLTKQDASDTYVTETEFEERIADLSTHGFITQTQADARYVQLDALDDYYTQDESDARYMPADTASLVQTLSAAGYITESEISQTYVSEADADLKYLRGCYAQDGDAYGGQITQSGASSVTVTFPLNKVQQDAPYPSGLSWLEEGFEINFNVGNTSRTVNGTVNLSIKYYNASDMLVTSSDGGSDSFVGTIQPNTVLTWVWAPDSSVLGGHFRLANNVLQSSGGGSSVIANPTGTASTDLTKLQVDGTIYAIPQGGGTAVVANPTGTGTEDLTKISVAGVIYDVPGTGSIVTGNPSGSATQGDLTSIEIDGEIYDIPGSNSSVSISDGILSITL